MRLIHIVGKKNHGKTTLMVALMEELTRRGVRVGSIKHSSHVHELDKPDSDSHRHRQAGARPAAIITQDLIALYLPRLAARDFYDQLAPMFSGCDLVLVEGDIEALGTKVEVWRSALGGGSLAVERGDIAAVVTDDPLDLPVPIWPRHDVVAVAEHILAIGNAAQGS